MAVTDGVATPAWADRYGAEALCVRAAALHVLATGQRPPDVTWGQAESAASEAWHLCLSIERCAVPLVNALAKAGLYRSLPRAAADVLRERSAQELKRAMSASAQLAHLARLVGSQDDGAAISAVLLKGAAYLATGQHIDLDDIDVLLPPGRAHAYAAQLEATGYQRAPGEGHHSFGAHVADQSVPVEVHFDIPHTGLGADVFDRAGAIARFPGLGRLAPADHLWHLLVETVFHHTFRRGRLRDLVLLGAAVRDCTPADRAHVLAHIATAADAIPMRASYEMALAVAEERAPDDAFREIAAANYLVACTRFPQHLPPWAEWGEKLLLAGLGGAHGRRHLLDAVMSRADTPSRRSWLTWLERTVPFVARTVRVGSRVVRVAAIAPVAWPIARRARRITARATAGMSSATTTP